MPAFGALLTPAEIEALVALIYTPLPEVPAWGAAEIAASRSVNTALPAVDKPVFEADPLNLFVVVETGDHHATILDGDRFEPIHRFPTRFALHGGPKFTPDGRYVFFMSRDGWVTKFDLYALASVAEARAGINSRNIAISEDGLHIAVANYLPNTLVMLSAEGSLAGEGLPGQGPLGQAVAGLGGLSGAAPQELRRGAQGRARDLGDHDRSRGRRRSSPAWCIPTSRA